MCKYVDQSNMADLIADCSDSESDSDGVDRLNTGNNIYNSEENQART